MVRRGALALVMGLLAPFLAPEDAEPADASMTLCGRRDLPETGVPGDVPMADQRSGRADLGYNCGLAVVGHSSLGGRGNNANMAWSGDCAYIAGAGVAVVDVSDPADPKHVTTLHTGGTEASLETIHAVDAPDRSILVAGRYGIGGANGFPGMAPVDVFDVSDCTRPTLLSTIQFPSNVHNLTLTADGRRVWSTLPLQAADISDPRRPVLLGSPEPQIAEQSPHLQYAHEAWPSPDGTRLYIGNQNPFEVEALLVVDIEGWPARPAQVLGGVSWPAHSLRPMQIDGKPYLLASDESIVNYAANGCLPDKLTPFAGVARPAIIDISHEMLPRIRSQLRLPINDPKHCVEQLASGVNASGHYHEVDDPEDTTFAMVSMWNAGLRIFDVRDPDHPREVAYFNPGRFEPEAPFQGSPGISWATGLTGLSGLDRAWAHTRYRPDTGHLWLTTATGGFWVLELEPQVRDALDLPDRPATHPQGAPARPPSTRGMAATVPSALLPTYCAISTARVL